MQEAIIRTLDLETTDFPPEGEVVELGYYDMKITREDEDAPWRVAKMGVHQLQKFFLPDAQMTLEARSTHHIRDSDLVGATHHSKLNDFAVGQGVSIYCAHNADFEKQFIKIPEGSHWLCTFKVATRALPDAAKHNNQYLKYLLGIDLPDEVCMPPHRALPDSVVTAHILAHMLNNNTATLREMVQWTREPLYLTKLTFGKHFGKRYDECPADYLSWILRQSDMDAAVHAAARRALGYA